MSLQVFPRLKKSGGVRIILNLSELNLNIEYCHFKMENLNTALGLIESNCFMASIDLKDAYFLLMLTLNIGSFFAFSGMMNFMNLDVLDVMVCHVLPGFS